MDIAPGMLERARRQSRWLRRFARVRADAYSLPFRDGAFELVFSSLMLQWCDDLDAVFAEIARVLAPGGLLLFSTFGPGTLAELREAWARSRRRQQSREPFLRCACAGQRAHAGAVERTGAGCRSHRRALPGRHEPDARAQGHRRAQRHAAAAPADSPGARRLSAMTDAYETLRRDGKLPATWEVIHASAWGSARARSRKTQAFRARRSSARARSGKRGQT